MTPEGAIQKAITDWLSTLPGCWFYKVHAQKPGKNGSQKTGVPDLTLESRRHGRVWIEIKTPKGTLTDSQKREIPKMQAAGATVIIVRSLEELRDALDALEVGDYL
ncbi:MAG: VRR-NUC domain-containing protein [Taibaiella sp.]|nr:VRR-NUC domain-containing protein [Taibaiella sp.]